MRDGAASAIDVGDKDAERTLPQPRLNEVGLSEASFTSL